MVLANAIEDEFDYAYIVDLRRMSEQIRKCGKDGTWMYLRQIQLLELPPAVGISDVIDYLKENNFTSSLLKLRQGTKTRNYKHSLFEHHPNVFVD